MTTLGLDFALEMLWKLNVSLQNHVPFSPQSNGHMERICVPFYFLLQVLFVRMSCVDVILHLGWVPGIHAEASYSRFRFLFETIFQHLLYIPRCLVHQFHVLFEEKELIMSVGGCHRINPLA